MTSRGEDARPQANTPVGITYQELLDNDSRPVAEAYRRRGNGSASTLRVPIERYLSREFHELEKQRLWRRVWQWACREEELAQVGNVVVYEICDMSIILVRLDDDERPIRAFHNSCLHRGRALRDSDGWVSELRCPFHGFCWSLDGRLKALPSGWDFKQVVADSRQFDLPEVQVGTWGGFVFVNMEPACESLESFLGDLPEHFETWALEDRFVDLHIAKVVNANWKILQEAFMESLHIASTHPQILPAFGDLNSQCEVFDNYSRVLSPRGISSPLLAERPSEQQIADAIVDRRLDESIILEVPEGETARRVAAERVRESLRSSIGERAELLSDADLLDSCFYTLFPNFHPWGGYSRIVYRFRPHGDSHNSSVMEILLLTPFDGERPEGAAPVWLTADEPWTNVESLGSLGRVLEQDMRNVEAVQRGLRAAKQEFVILSEYQEIKIRHFHDLLERWVNSP